MQGEVQAGADSTRKKWRGSECGAYTIKARSTILQGKQQQAPASQGSRQRISRYCCCLQNAGTTFYKQLLLPPATNCWLLPLNIYTRCLGKPSCTTPITHKYPVRYGANRPSSDGMLPVSSLLPKFLKRSAHTRGGRGGIMPVRDRVKDPAVVGQSVAT